MLPSGSQADINVPFVLTTPDLMKSAHTFWIILCVCRWVRPPLKINATVHLTPSLPVWLLPDHQIATFCPINVHMCACVFMHICMRMCNVQYVHMWPDARTLLGLHYWWPAVIVYPEWTRVASVFLVHRPRPIHHLLTSKYTHTVESYLTKLYNSALKVMTCVSVSSI